MAWTSPPTFTDGAVLSGAQLNLIRDGLNETAPAKATAAGQLFVSTAANAIAARTPAVATITTTQTTTSASYTNLATTGPSVTVTTGSSALILIAAGLSQNTLNGYASASYDVSGATSVSAGDDWAVTLRAAVANQQITAGTADFRTGLTPGSNTFTMRYMAGSGGGTATFFNRRIAVIPF